MRNASKSKPFIFDVLTVLHPSTHALIKSSTPSIFYQKIYRYFVFLYNLLLKNKNKTLSLIDFFYFTKVLMLRTKLVIESNRKKQTLISQSRSRFVLQNVEAGSG